MEVARYWRTTKQRYELVGERCEKCSAEVFPPRGVCPNCKSGAMRGHAFSGQGEVYSFSNIHVAPHGFEKFAPYHVALIRLTEGPLITAQLTDVDAADVYVGMPVEMVTRVLREDGEKGILVYGYKFRPLWFHETGSHQAASEPVRLPERNHQQAEAIEMPALVR
jgi:uncharacterized protein